MLCLKNILKLTVFVVAVQGMIGCAAVLVGGGAAAGVGSYAYINGEMKATFAKSVSQLHAAAQKALSELRFKVKESKFDALGGKIRASTADERAIQVDLKSLSATTSEIYIRVGILGDESASRLIMDHVKSHL